MIAAVVDPRGREAAESTLRRLCPEWTELRARGEAVVARTRDAGDECAVRDETRLADAARDARSGAFVALDADGGALLARGSLGGRPLYYARTADDGWIACSQMAPLVRAAGSRFRPDPDRLASLAAGLADPRDDATAFAGVSRVPPCAAVRLVGSRALVHRRPREARTLLDPPVEELAAELWRRVEGAVRRATEGASRVAVMVGGGVDSSSLLAAAVAVARGASTREVHALALDFDAIGTDRPYLAALAAALGIVPVRLAPRDAGPYFTDSLVLDAQPYTLGIGPLERLVFGRARDLGAEVLLSGYMADEILAGDLRGLAVEALEGSPLRAARRAMRLRLPWESTPRKRVEDYVVRPILKPFVPRALLARNGARGEARLFPWAGARLRRVLAELREQATEGTAPRSPTERFERFARSVTLADFADLRGQMEAATGLVRKDPYADEDVLDLLARVRPEVMCHDDMHRGLFRAAIRGRVPESIRARLDKSYFEPALAEMADAAGGLSALGDLWTPRALERLSIVDAARFRRAMEPLFRAPASTSESAELWALATQVIPCEAFARGFEAGA
ncbi:MAG: hypothetical protein KF819_23505 [Labilithrix sp.]|nr:hypothetical protein [Labilithrix sp.]